MSDIAKNLASHYRVCGSCDAPQAKRTSRYQCEWPPERLLTIIKMSHGEEFPTTSNLDRSEQFLKFSDGLRESIDHHHHLHSETFSKRMLVYQVISMRSKGNKHIQKQGQNLWVSSIHYSFWKEESMCQ